MKMGKILLAVAVIIIIVVVVGFITENRLSDFAKNLLAGVPIILLAFLLGWFFVEKRASMWLGKIGTLLERDEQHQRSVQRSWAETVLSPLAVILLEVTHQLFHDLQDIEDKVSIGWEDSISQEAKKVSKEVDAFFRPDKDKFIEINSAAASSLTQSGKLLERLEAYLKSGPDWIREDTQIAKLLQEAVACIGNLDPALFMYSNVHPMSRRVQLPPKAFEHIVAGAHCTSLWRYLSELTNLTIALDEKVHREGFGLPPLPK